MNKFISEYKIFLIKETKSINENIDIKFINLDLQKSFNFNKKESLLHNSVDFLNKKLLKNINKNSYLIEIGCGSNSLILNSKNKFLLKKDGLDVHEYNFRGEYTLNNLIGSVDNIPIRSNQYDYCISNQSMEHWHEYNVTLSKGVSEIARVLKKKSGRLIINFPLFLHGKREFVNGNLKYVIKEISKFLCISNINIIYSKKNNYYGWKLCNQPPSRVKNYLKSKGIYTTPNSCVCEIIAIKKIDNLQITKKVGNNFKRLFNLYKDYTFYEILYKLVFKLRKKIWKIYIKK